MDNADKIFDQLQANFKRAMSTLPAVIGNEVVNFAKERFEQQNWLDKGPEPWVKRSSKTKRNQGRNILVDSGRLKRSPRVISANTDLVGVGSDVPYARAHNDGFDGSVNIKSHQRKSRAGKVQTVGTVKAHVRNMKLPRRRFLGQSYEMVERLKQVAANHLIKSIK